MSEAVMEFIRTNLSQIVAGGTAFGCFMGALAHMSGYAIKQVLGLFDK